MIPSYFFYNKKSIIDSDEKVNEKSDFLQKGLFFVGRT